jgi:Lantibiotic dehydratase, N terminus
MTSLESLSAHAVLPGTKWSLWREVVLRAPGFPAGGVELLASPDLARAADRFNERDQEANYADVFGTEMKRLNSRILRLASDRHFGAALAWQNHQVFDTAIAPMLRNKHGDDVRRNSKHRQHEELLASYWQRYCVKNDTIGFFGPVGWGVLDPLASITRLSTGQDLVASSEVFFEPWVIDQLARAIAAEPGMAEWISPRMLPFVRIEGTHAVGPARVPVELAQSELATLQRCTGLRAARDIADEVLGLVPDVTTREEVYAIIARLGKKRLLTWKLETPTTPHPERHLRRFLQRVGDQELASGGLARLDALEAARDAAQQASSGDVAGFVAALRDLDTVFTTATGASPSRRAGQAYGGRTLIYHDARRDIQLALGTDFLTALEPLSLILDSARWLTSHFATRLQAIFTGVATRMSAGGAGPSLAAFWFECISIIYRSAPAIIGELQQEFQRRWADILRVPAGARRVRLEAAALRDSVDSAFAAPAYGWSAGRYYSPDLMVAASGIDAINRGDFDIVLGEMHLAIPTCRHYCFVTQHPAPADLLECLAIDFPGPRLLPMAPKEDHDRLTIRTQSALTRDMDFLVALTVLNAEPNRPRLVDAAALTVEVTPDGPVVTVPGGPTFPVIDVFAEMLVQVFMNSFALVPDVPHQPRVSIDRLVIARETWRFDVSQIGFASLRDEADRYAAARAWRDGIGLPRRVFVKAPGEVKPFYVDFDSVVSVTILARSLRRLQGRPEGSPPAWIAVSEMLPSAEDLWLTDAQGQHYTSEVRIVAVDQQGVDGGPCGTHLEA